ncbi:MAG: hypothetical protein ACLR8L_00005, partial [Oscillospiraceae bacterium]
SHFVQLRIARLNRRLQTESTAPRACRHALALLAQKMGMFPLFDTSRSSAFLQYRGEFLM